jgi:hypothetical protein
MMTPTVLLSPRYSPPHEASTNDSILSWTTIYNIKPNDMKKIFLVLLLVAAATVTYSFTLAPAAPSTKLAQATPIVFDDSYSFTDVFFNECSGEVVELDGTGEFSVRGVMNNNRFNITFHTVEKYVGENYTGTILLNETQTGSLTNGQFTASFKRSGILATPGGGNNIKFANTFHLTVNANGEVSIVRDENTWVCQ